MALACVVVVGILVAGGSGMTAQAQVAVSQDQDSDPADVNMAPTDGAAQSQDPNVAQQQQQAPPPSSGIQNESQQKADEMRKAGQQSGLPADAQQQQAPAQSYPQGYPQNPQDQGYPAQGYPAQGYPAQANPPNQPTDAQVDAGQTAIESDQEPPPLPEYEQPAAPAPNYIWTPGYWYWAPAGYYWVPGVWVLAPYPGALWTPGYWCWYHHHYYWYHGYWGTHIGYYGGINYGFGYTGYGYHGGYWNGNAFYYNTTVNRVNTFRITNVYTHTIVVNNNTRVAYNGGRGGVQAAPHPAEIAAMREARTPQMTTQVQNRHQASQNGAQYYQQNQGHPGFAANPRPVPADTVQRPQQPRGYVAPTYVTPSPQYRGGTVQPQTGNHQYGAPTPYVTPVPQYRGGTVQPQPTYRPDTVQPVRPPNVQSQPHPQSQPQSQPHGQSQPSGHQR
jgi:hypothetical protein